MYYIYLLRCKDNTIYTGITNNINNRMNNHFTNKGAKYTKSHDPLKVELLYKCKNKSLASSLEYKLKTLTKKQKEELILNHNLKKYLPEIDLRHYKLLELNLIDERFR